jgi:hypothetical protein
MTLGSVEEKPIATLLKELAESLNQACGGADQMAMHLDSPDFIVLAQTLDLFKGKTMEMATFHATKIHRV